jgi:23S rRNA (uracil-5-)-methyltransferase RumA
MNPPQGTAAKPCRHFGTCGGCDFQDKEYAEQLRTKEDLLRELFLPLSARIENIIPSPQIFHYRNKMEYAVNIDMGNLCVGLRQKKRFYKIVDLKECKIFRDSIADVLDVFRAWIDKNKIEPYHLRKHTGNIRYAVMRHSKYYNELMVIAVLARPLDIVTSLTGSLKNIDSVRSVYLCINSSLSDVSMSGQMKLLYGQNRIKEKINDIDYYIGPDSFFQTNPYCCAELYRLIKENVSGIGGQALDMCCGSGGIALQLAGDFEKIVGVDISEENIKLATDNAVMNKKDNVKFVCCDAEKFGAMSGFSTIILDPPRAGLGKKARAALLESGVENVVYVSCNPANLARDLANIAEKYSIKKIIPVDMFPHTRHLEVVAILKRNKV